MFISVQAVRGIQGRLHAGSAGIARRADNRRALKRSLHVRPPLLRAKGSSSSAISSSYHLRNAQAFSTAGRAGQAVQVLIKGKALPGTPDIVHDRFLECVEKEDAKGAMAHFAFIACEGGALLTLRRRQLLVILCEKGMVKEASELLTSAIASPAFDSQDLSTIASFMYVMCGCLRHGDVDRALGHFRQASERAIGLDLPLCEGLATALFIKGLRGEATEVDAWNVLEYIRQRGMVHRPEVCDRALLYAVASDDLSFALRMCQYADDEGLWCDSNVRDALCRSVALAIKKLPDTDAVTSEGDAGGNCKVEGTNATAEELWALDTLLQKWIDIEMEEADDDSLDDEEGIAFVVDEEKSDENDGGDDVDVFAEGGDYDGKMRPALQGFFGDVGNEVAGRRSAGDEQSNRGDDVDRFADVVDYDGGDIHVMNVDDMESAADVVDFDDGLEDDDDDDAAGGSHVTGDVTTARSQRAAWREEKAATDFGGDEFCGDLIDQMSALHPEQDRLSFRVDDEMVSFPDGFRWGERRGDGGGRGVGHDWTRRAVYADLVMPYGDPHGDGEQGIMSIPVKISVGHEDDNNDDDDDDEDGAN